MSSSSVGKYTKRNDGRSWTQLRKMDAKAGVIKNADGSAMFKIGNTVALAAVYGPRELHPKFMQDPKTGILRVRYNMLPFSGSGDRVRPGGNRRSKELSMVIEKALLPVVDLTKFPNTVVDVFIEFPQTDAGTRCAAICAASIALADAGIPMKDMVQAVSAGRVGDKLVVDLDYSEESWEPGPVADIPVGIIYRTGEVVLLQMDGDVTKQMLKDAILMARDACKEILDLQKKALNEKYIGGGDDNVDNE